MICSQWSVLVALVLAIGCSRGTSGGGIGGTSAGGIGGASAGAGGDAAPPPQGLIFDNGGRSNYPSLERCDANGGCSSGKVCFHVTPDIGLCDAPEPPAVTMCTMGGFGGNPPDECSCNGSTCAADEVCINVQEEGSGGLFGRYNACVDTACVSHPTALPDDLHADLVHRPGRLSQR